MVSTIPGYMYSLVAALIVGSILIYTCSVATLGIQHKAETQQLLNIDKYVAAQSLTLLSQVTHNGQNATVNLDLPAAIGNQRYWITITNDTHGTWVKSGFGTEVNPTDIKIEVPAAAAATGTIISGSGWPTLICSLTNQTANLTLTMGD